MTTTRAFLLFFLAACASRPLLVVSKPAPAVAPASCPALSFVEPFPASVFDEIILAYADAQKRVRGGFVEEGVSQLKRLIATYPNFAIAYRGLGIAHALRSSWVSAYSSYVAYLQFDEVREEDRVEVRKELARLATKHPALAHYKKGVDLLTQGDPRPALEWLLLSQQAKPEFPLVHRALGIVYAKLDNPEASIEHYKEYVMLDPTARDRSVVEAIIKDWDRSAPAFGAKK